MMIESAQSSDVGDIAKLNEVFRRAASKPDWYESASWIKPRLENFHVIRDQNGIAAHACVSIYSDHAKLDILSVREDCRSQGLGRTLVNYAVEKAREAEVSELRVGSGKRFKVKDYYLQQGFEVDLARTTDCNHRFLMKL